MVSDLAIEATGLVKSYGKVEVLRGIDLAIPRGSVYALLGPNGVGKTTTVRILSTLIRPDAGRATVAGFDVVSQRREVQQRISLTGQYAAVDDMQTGLENLYMMGRLYGLSAKQARLRAVQRLELFEFADAGKRRVGTYSGGMRRRLDLAASLVGDPSVIFLDEPTTGLDLPSRRKTWQVIGELARSGITIFLTTQYLEEADLLADRIGVMNGGRMAAEGTPAELKRLIADQRLNLVMGDEASFRSMLAAVGTRILRSDPQFLTITLETGGSAPEVRALLDRIDPTHSLIKAFTISAVTLDDVFLALTARAADGAASGAETEKETVNV